MLRQIIETYTEWESLLKKLHSENKTIGCVVESNRKYQTYISFEERISVLNEMDVIVYVFNPQYQKTIEIDDELSLKLYGDKPKDSPMTAIEGRKDYVDYIYIKEPYLPYRNEVKEWIYKNAPLMSINDRLDSYSYIRGCYATEEYINLIWREPVDLFVACPFALKYNFVCKHLVEKFGVKMIMPGDITEDKVFGGKV